ncbi:hypothetical protein Hanom_Chr01g00032981 [Helianthus anomalus]
MKITLASCNGGVAAREITILLCVPRGRVRGVILVEMVWVRTISLTSGVASVTTFRQVQIQVESGGCTCNNNQSYHHQLCPYLPPSSDTSRWCGYTPYL